MERGGLNISTPTVVKREDSWCEVGERVLDGRVGRETGSEQAESRSLPAKAIPLSDKRGASGEHED